MKYNHPHEKIAEFVNNYEADIKPLLAKGEEGKLELISKATEICKDFFLETDMIKVFEKNPEANAGALGRYLRANQLLLGYTMIETQGHNLNWAKSEIKKYISEIDEILSENPHYKNIRRKAA